MLEMSHIISKKMDAVNHEMNTRILMLRARKRQHNLHGIESEVTEEWYLLEILFIVGT